ncbi:hypothetical protein TVAG_128930 [Trichomonas vaginalis G3]|uniref:Uncharacterized protein n=1 Tax=Trichomonas vaginalis (strain ATCC PRA-98 / G3) TaxID=412133 RepID=A2E4E4_TRIV3|nr:dolichyl-phosphate-mannose-glycolipid alpha-mannosyltransferase protein [Trichomonas vaginalis G3]EAY12479.1 hypothetical protein TVAG_128930 [Trichomonas vaginalis G3]KAI5539541.1 dolichyl-phosphate-mannose-glycolipid alpha-mannosyltransferase protein [Trichomonas vaginalis G3]|eukprot:XP_001324702.1 hypothetical protein [Trichomonas vaginalis G3]
MAFLCYWDGPNYVYAAKTLYKIPPNNPWTRAFRYPPSYFACHLPGYPLLIRFFATITLNCYWLGYVLAILFGSVGIAFVFRRLLVVYNCVVDPVYSSYLLLIIPIRLTLYKSVGASEPLYMMYVYLALIFFKTDQLIFMLLSMWGACITRIEGLSIVGTIGLSYLLRFDILRAMFTSLGFLATPAVAYFHQIRFHSYKAYINFNMNTAGLIRFPLYSLIIPSRYEKFCIQSHMLFAVITPLLAATVMMYTTCVPIAIYSTVYIIYVISIFHMDLFRYALPAFTVALIIGFDPIFSNPIFKARIIYFIGFPIVILLWYYYGQITTNKAPDDFLLEVLYPDKYRFNESFYYGHLFK